MPTNSINGFPSIQEMTDRIKNNRPMNPAQLNTGRGVSFEEVLRSRDTQELKFSKHAQGRMESRNIDLSQEQWERLESGVERAGQKGIKESLVMVDDLAFIVNVSSNTVITAVGEADEKIFTNIDGAVIA